MKGGERVLVMIKGREVGLACETGGRSACGQERERAEVPTDPCARGYGTLAV